ncbi:MAG TPA: hypothetical protein VGR47_13840 [Terracidiphilus sp.]|nr:hypothetical protein [Terracidiphilus sp.]
MKFQVGIVVLTASLLAGCGSSPGSAFGSLSSANVTGNWQIQTSANSSAASPQGIVLLGALENSGSQVSGTFRFTNLAQPYACGSNEVVSLSGAAGSNNLTLTSATLPNGTTIKVSLKIMGAQPYSGLGTVEVDGSTCAVAAASAIGSQIASTTGTFSGTLSPGALGTPASGAPGSATVTLTQSAAPGSDGQFTETGTLSYKIGSCSGSVPLSGTVSGVGMSFWDVIFSDGGGQQQVNLSGTTNLAATQISAGLLSLSPAPCSTDPDSSATFNGQLNRK